MIVTPFEQTYAGAQGRHKTILCKQQNASNSKSAKVSKVDRETLDKCGRLHNTVCTLVCHSDGGRQVHTVYAHFLPAAEACATVVAVDLQFLSKVGMLEPSLSWPARLYLHRRALVICKLLQLVDSELMHADS